MRIDKWLWAACFFKPRSLATDAVAGGKVRLAGQTIKPAREVRPDDRLDLRVGDDDREVVVEGPNKQRRPATEARLLYQETPENAERRGRAAELRKLARRRPRTTTGVRRSAIGGRCRGRAAGRGCSAIAHCTVAVVGQPTSPQVRIPRSNNERNARQCDRHRQAGQ